MPLNGSFILTQQPENGVEISWPAAFEADFYRVQVSIPAASEKADPKVLMTRDVTDGTSCVLTGLPEDRSLTLSVTCGVHYSSFGRDRVRLGDDPMTVTTTLAPPVIDSVSCEASPEKQAVWVDYESESGNCCRVYVENEDGSLSQIRETSDNTFCLTFGNQGELEIPSFDAPLHLVLDAYRQEPGLLFYGVPSAEVSISRGNLLGREMNAQFTDLGDNVFSVSWEETKGDYYEIQHLNSETDFWECVCRVPADAPRTYTSPRLPCYETRTYRVAAVGGETKDDSPYAAVSQEYTIKTEETPVLCTVWPTKELTVYTDAEKTAEAGTAETGRAFCVLAEENGMFRVRFNGEPGYIDSRYCLINLPEYIGDLVQYRITNSCDCQYTVHEFEIPDMTGTVIGGYENIAQQDGTFLVPLLYPTAKKLASAGKNALHQGYQLKIYDAFRPQEATDFIYTQAESILKLPIPEFPCTGTAIEDLNLPDPQPGGDLGPNGLSYEMVMTNNLYGLKYFLASGGSAHNQGVAMDLTMVSLETGKEIDAQSSIHDLSRYSVTTDNNKNTEYLADIMTGAGFSPLVSEWWHFQDNETRKELDPPYVQNGLSGACWMSDDEGWRYRTRDGSFYADCIARISGEDYIFDSRGYYNGISE